MKQAWLVFVVMAVGWGYGVVLGFIWRGIWDAWFKRAWSYIAKELSK